MVITNSTFIPDDDELTVQEVNIGTPALRAAAFHIGKYCEYQNNEFMLCRQELDDPRPCIQEGKLVTACTLEFFRKLKKTCYDEFTQYTRCLDKSSSRLEYDRCRMTQSIYDKCVLDNLNLERPQFGYFCEVKVHDSPRPKPQPQPKAVYPDIPDHLPPGDYPPPRFGARSFFFD
ncbi:NADH dehydrogenase [ubiquinone] 1 alpha subcomplex subunit 8 [Athalia rosae]|uniref:NADH dehydrogenase [ubiquinone] 1 alpha subcomplex subunit 8 n=1 Tax=Athalia rosae TaxID=37344 RepID=UPI002034531F|nr:NADH dehydrogenase [ubiquinone] 1 alpha subcomplex subunit 8 [Athalia rosae]